MKNAETKKVKRKGLIHYGNHLTERRVPHPQQSQPEQCTDCKRRSERRHPGSVPKSKRKAYTSMEAGGQPAVY